MAPPRALREGYLQVYATVKNLPLPLHVHVVGPVHHDLADLRVLEQSLDGTEADDFIRNLIHDLADLTRRKDGLSFSQYLHDFGPNPKAPLGWTEHVQFGRRPIDQSGPNAV